MICTLLTFFCFAWHLANLSVSLSACAQAAVSVSFGSPNASFLHVKEATERQIILPRMRKNSPFRCQKSQNFMGRGHSPLPDPTPVGRGRGLSTPPPHTLPPLRLRRLDSRAFGARPRRRRRLDPRAFGARTRRLRRLDPPICAMTNITYFRPCSSPYNRIGSICILIASE